MTTTATTGLPITSPRMAMECDQRSERDGGLYDEEEEEEEESLCCKSIYGNKGKQRAAAGYPNEIR